MKQNTRQIKITMNGKRMTGSMLLEVVLAIAVFAFGMLALVQLQGNLTRSSADANARTVATNIAEEIVERIRGYQQVTADPDNGMVDFLELVGNSQDTVVRRGRLGNDEGGLDYTVNIAIKDFWYDPATDAFKNTDATEPPTPPDGLEHLAWADFKMLEVKVAWSPNRDFYVDDENTANLGADGSAVSEITIYEIIPSSPPILGAKIAADLDPPKGMPPVDYTPGLRPDIIPVNLENSKFKESTTPMPDVIRNNEQMETWFDVITYSQVGDTGAFFLRREEFVSVSCECTIQAPSGSDDGFEPTLWAGIEYSEGEMVGKTFGESANNQQSDFCSTCCRDHHDSTEGNSSAETRYRSEMSSGYVANGAFTGNHPHFNRDRNGVLTEVIAAGKTYVEACRLIRKDGFFRVAQDFSMEALNGFPEDFLDEPGEIDVYSAYLTTGVVDHFENGTSPLLPPAEAFPGDELLPTNLPTPQGTVIQQLRSRGIYVDHLSARATEIYDCMNGGSTGDECGAPNVNSVLEILPFFDVQTTFLARWSETEPGNPVLTTNEELKVNNGHSRGKASLAGSKIGKSVVHDDIERGNIGLIGTVSIGGSNKFSMANVHVIASGSDVPPPPSGNATALGSINAEGGTSDAGVVSVSGSDATCSKPTNSTFYCEITGAAPIIRVSNYFKTNVKLIACSSDMTTSGSSQGADPSTNWTDFVLPSTGVNTGIVITIKRFPC